MTEDDTFRLLKRTPYSQIRKLVSNNEYGHLIGGFSKGTLNVIHGSSKTSILESNGWTKDEYDAACRAENPLLHAFLDSIKDLKHLD